MAKELRWTTATGVSNRLHFFDGLPTINQFTICRTRATHLRSTITPDSAEKLNFCLGISREASSISKYRPRCVYVSACEMQTMVTSNLPFQSGRWHWALSG